MNRRRTKTARMQRNLLFLRNTNVVLAVICDQQSEPGIHKQSLESMRAPDFFLRLCHIVKLIVPQSPPRMFSYACHQFANGKRMLYKLDVESLHMLSHPKCQLNHPGPIFIASGQGDAYNCFCGRQICNCIGSTLLVSVGAIKSN